MGVKIAVISDIHGNIDALEAVLEDIKQQNCNKIYCLGDYAMAGPEPQKTIERIMSLKNNIDVQMIQGNTDLMIADFTESMYISLKETAPVMAEALKNDFEIIPKNQKDLLRELPPQLLLEEENIKILLVHGSPRKNNENIFPDTPMNEIEEMTANTDAEYILCGHTHIPCGFQASNKKTIVNVGSVGRPFTQDPLPCYAVMTLSDGKCLFEHRFVKYNNLLASEKLSKRNFEGADKLAQMLINPVVRHF